MRPLSALPPGRFILRSVPFVLVLLYLSIAPASGQSAAELYHELLRFREMGRVLHIAAHPDDENTQLIAYLVHGRAYKAAYLSMTRGKGGQNLIGEELGAGLGAIRAHELLEARAIDGGEQYFTRAPDFGYSKDYRETLEKWDHETVLSDVVRVIRTFRPHVIVTRFPPEPLEGMHGHHTASAVLAVEAFGLAGDPSVFPDQLDDLEPWQPTRVVWNQFGDGVAERPYIEIDIGGYAPLRGESFGEIAAKSRSMHKSQGFGAVGTRGRQLARFVHLAGQQAEGDLFDDIDASWTEIEGGSIVLARLDSIINEFDIARPSESVSGLLELRSFLKSLPSHPGIRNKQRDLDRILVETLGLYVETRIPAPDHVIGDTLRMTHTAVVRSGVPVRWQAVNYPDGTDVDPIELVENVPATRRSSKIIRSATAHHPEYRRTQDSGAAISEDRSPVYPIQHLFEVGGQVLTVEVNPEHVYRDPVRGEIRHALTVVPPAVLRFEDAVSLIPPGDSSEVHVEVRAKKDRVAGVLELELPEGWSTSPSSHAFSFDNGGDSEDFSFTIRAPMRSERVEIVAAAQIDNETYHSSIQEIVYDHIPRIVLFPDARLVAMSAEINIAGRSIGYIHGAGDAVGEGLRRMSYEVASIDPSSITAESLKEFDAIVLGIRALNTRDDLDPIMDLLFDYVRRGGTLVMQYNVSRGLVTDQIAPHHLTIGRGRITNETAPLTPLANDHPILNHPNDIISSDFEGWVQERGLYFAESWDDSFTPILSGNDPGEDPLEGALVVAEYGAGFFVYTGLSFFRQIPAGVPGAYRLLANIVSLGQ